ncbi:MAG TPA: hypothetical protein DDW49_03530, partial [Deltaproteobacteria bacterium]|nr:hypothetical protein [Deltaproteobacteria bacterium]
GDDESEKDDKKNEDGVSSTESGKACGTLSGSALELNIPIGVDYSAQLSNFDATQEREKRLSHITLDLHYPESCRVKNIDFPSFIEPVDAELKEKTFNPDSHEISLETVIAILQVRNACRRSNFETAIHDTIRTCPLEIILTNDGSVGDKQFSFAPKALCPDEKEIELPKTDIEVDGHDDFEVAQSAADNNGDGAWAPGEAVTIQTLVKNNTAMDFTDDDLELTLTTPSQVVNQRFEMQGGQCVPQANSGVCRFALRFGQQITVTTRFNLPNNIDQNSNTFSVGAKLEVKAKGETVPFEASPVVITVPVGNQ